MIALAAVCYGLTGLLEPHIAIGGKSPLEPAILTILLGLLLRHVGWVPAACDTGVKRYEGALKVGIVLLGLNLTFLQVISLGAQAITVVLICLLAAPTFIYVIARRLSIAPKLAVLIGIGTTICGSTAIAIAAPLAGCARVSCCISGAGYAAFPDRLLRCRAARAMEADSGHGRMDRQTFGASRHGGHWAQYTPGGHAQSG